MTTTTSTPIGIQTEGPTVEDNIRINKFSIIIPIIGSLAWIISLPYLSITWTTLFVFAVFFAFSVLGVGVGLHRYFSHRSFKTGVVIEFFLAYFGTICCQGPIDRWVADHRRHHRYSDSSWDTHSPYWNGNTKLVGFRGWFHAHIGWMLQGHISDPKRYAADIRFDSIAGWASKHYWLLCFSGYLLPGACGLFYGLDEALRCLLFAGFFRVTLLHNLTWSVNSFGHMFGKKGETPTDESRDNIFLALLLFGEGLHASHHEHPTRAINGSFWKDHGGAIIILAKKLKLVHSVRIN